MIANLCETLGKFFHVFLSKLGKKLNTGLQFQLIFAKMLDITKHCYKGFVVCNSQTNKGDCHTIPDNYVNLKNSFC